MSASNVLIVSDGDDMAGVNYGIKQAFDKHSTRYRMRQVRGTDNYIRYPVDISWMGNNTFVNQLYNAADLIHISEYPWALDGGSAPKIWNKVRKPTVIHQHGVPFRSNPKLFLDIARREGYRQIVSTIDLLIDPSLVWIPNPVNIERMAELREKHFPNDGVLRIGQAPTNVKIKNTADFIEVCKDLQKRYGIEYHIIQNVTWKETLRQKARMDIWFDQLTYGYGNNGIEAAAMGIPVVGGFSDKQVEQRLLETVGSLPFQPATEESLRDVLEGLIEDAGLREAAGLAGREYMRSVHSEIEVVKKLEEVYDRTINEFEAR